MEPRPLVFRGGVVASAIPLMTFLVVATGLVIARAPTTEGMILGAMAGLSLGLFFARDRACFADYVFTLMANKTATVAIVCWLWAGAFSGLLGDSGLVEAIVWVGWKLQLSGAAFTVAVFISASLFAVSVGTGLGTILGFTAVMYPAGVVLGAAPEALMGAILSGAAFGDNLAPISDTTIVSAATQESDVGTVVKSRLKYVLIASSLSIVLFWFWGGGASDLDSEVAMNLLAETADPKGLPMLLPAALVFVVAIVTRNFLFAITLGILSAALLGPIIGVFSFADIFAVADGGTLDGSLVRGAMGLVPTAVLTLMLVTAIGIMEAGGFLARFMDWLRRAFAATVRGTEGAILILITIANVCVSVNTVAMITVGPLANVLRKGQGVRPERSANILDTVSCSFPYLLPYSATISAAVATQQEVASRFPFMEVVPWSGIVSHAYYGMVLYPLMILFVLTGFGRKKGS